MAALLWPGSVASDGEMDWPEFRMDDGRGATAFHHFDDPAGGQKSFSPGDFAWTEWHRYGLRYVAGELVEFSLDGRVLITMPHPERSFRISQHSWYPRDAEGEYSGWMRMFRNARAWVG